MPCIFVWKQWLVNGCDLRSGLAREWKMLPVIPESLAAASRVQGVSVRDYRNTMTDHTSHFLPCCETLYHHCSVTVCEKTWSKYKGADSDRDQNSGLVHSVTRTGAPELPRRSHPDLAKEKSAGRVLPSTNQLSGVPTTRLAQQLRPTLHRNVQRHGSGRRNT